MSTDMFNKNRDSSYMNLRDFFSPDFDKEIKISHEDVQHLNAILAKTSVAEIPVNDRPQVLGYLETVLFVARTNEGPMDPEIQSKLESLCSELEDCRTLET